MSFWKRWKISTYLPTNIVRIGKTPTEFELRAAGIFSKTHISIECADLKKCGDATEEVSGDFNHVLSSRGQDGNNLVPTVSHLTVLGEPQGAIS